MSTTPPPPPPQVPPPPPGQTPPPPQVPPPPAPGAPVPPATGPGQVPPPSGGTTPPPPAWGQAPPTGGGDGSGGGRKPLLFVGLGVLVLVLLIVGIVVVSGGDDGGGDAASGSSGEPAGDTGDSAGATEDGVRIVELGTIGPGEAASVEIGEDDVSFLLTMVGEDPEEFLTYTSITAPNGDAIYEADVAAGTAEGGLTGFTRTGTGEASVLVPVQPGLDIEPGTYEVEMDNLVPVEATAVIKSGDVSPGVTQALDLNVWLLSSDHDQATLESELEDRSNAVLKPQNLEIGEVTFTQADDEDIEAVGVVDSDGLLAETCTAMREAIGTSRELNLAIIETFQDSTVGLAAAIPGGPQTPGSNTDCVIAATQVDGELVDLPEMGSTVVHEAAHLFGLFHTTEGDGASGDDFGDTPDCILEEVDGREGFGYPGEEDGMISATECGVEGGGANFMFFESSPLDTRDVLTQTEMTDDQAWALRRHPLFYPVGGGGSAESDPADEPAPTPDEDDSGSTDGTPGEAPSGGDAVSVETISEYGSDATLDGYADGCEAGDFVACDDLWLESPIDSDYEAYGATCGGRNEPLIAGCADRYG